MASSRINKDCKFLKEGFVYNSLNNNFLSISNIEKLIKENNIDFEKLSD